MDIQEQVAIHMCGFDGVQRGELIRRTEAEATMRKLKSKKATSKDEVTEEMIKGGDDMVVD